MSHPLLTPEQRSRWFAIKERICIEAHCGQATDIFWSKRMGLEHLQRMLATDAESRILQMYAFKTASAATGASEFVCALAGADPQLTSACVGFARIFGVAYQIVDDIHNFSRSQDWTKITGEDLANGKLTFVIATALRMLPGAEADRLQEILCDREARHEPPILDEGVALVHRSGALDACRDLSREMVDRAWEGFNGRIRPSGPKVMLHAMCLKLIDLAYDG
jgi:geranylgeranyl pyrophosphate synthase